MISITELIKKVRYLINETEDDSGVTLITDDTRSIDDTIQELMPQAVAIVQKNSNGRYVNAKSLAGKNASLILSSDGFKSLVLPSDFVGLVSVKLDSWKVACTKVSSPSSQTVLYRLNNNLSSISSMPVCVEDVTENGTKALNLFPSCNSDTLSHFVYEASFNATEGLDMCEESMADAVSYVCAALLYNVFERYEAAKSFMSFAMTLCGGNVH